MKYNIIKSTFGNIALVHDEGLVKRIFLPEKDLEALHDRVHKSFANAECVTKLPGEFKELTVFLQKVAIKPPPQSILNKLDWSELSQFQKSVLKECAKIPPGVTASYSELADRIGHSGASRAVGTALALNPFPLLVPCHRIVRSGGKLGQFSAFGGTLTKAEFLEREGFTLGPATQSTRQLRL